MTRPLWRVRRPPGVKMNIKKFLTVVLGVSVLGIAACDPIPRRTLSLEEKKADLFWIYSQFGENYAPMEYKQTRYKFDYTALKDSYLQLAETTTTNEEFYVLMYRFVAEFKDAHTSGTLTASSLPSRTEIAYLGFTGVRRGDHLVVTKLLPTISKDSIYPIKVGQTITQLDGVSLKDVVLNEMVQYRNLGSDEANLTYHMSKIFNRVTTSQKLPTKSNAVLTVLKSDGVSTTQLLVPWIRKDLKVFREEQMAATPTTDLNGRTQIPSDNLNFQISLMALAGQVDLLADWKQILDKTQDGYNPWNSFVFVDSSPDWNSNFYKNTLKRMIAKKKTEVGKDLISFEDDPKKILQEDRNVPEPALMIPTAKIYPSYITSTVARDKDGKEVGKKFNVGYIHLDTFSPAASEDDTIKEVSATLDAFALVGVKDVVIDMINNGGGSLSLGVKLAQLFSKEKILVSEIQFRLSDSWLDDFESMSLRAGSDAERELYRRVFVGLKDERLQGKWLSHPMSIESLFPFELKGNENLNQKLNVVLLVNEMCASMCDIFSGIMKDNALATVVGTKTMGAGGNVVNHTQSPNSHFDVRQTESLILRKDGSYVENNGVDPDVAYAVNEDAISKYDGARAKAFDYIATQKLSQ